MKVTITIDTGNAAFDVDNGGPEQEVARILAEYARLLSDGFTNLQLAPCKLRDSNGNTVGAVRVDETPREDRPGRIDASRAES